MFDRFLLFIFKTKTIFDLIILVVISGLSYFMDENYKDPFLFTTTILAFCYIAYFEFLKDQKRRICFFYNAKTIKNLRIYTVWSCVRISVVFVPIALIIGVLNGNMITYFMHYILAILSFSSANYVVSINIEKIKNGTVITVRDLFVSTIICISTLLLLVLMSQFVYNFIYVLI